MGVALLLGDREVINGAQTVSNHCKSNGEIAGNDIKPVSIISIRQYLQPLSADAA